MNGIDVIAGIDYIAVMAVLSIRNLPDEVHAVLRVRAAKAGRSMEAEAREILTQACAQPVETAGPEALWDIVDRLYGDDKPESVTDWLIEERRREAKRS